MIKEASVDGSVYMDEAAHRRLKELVSPEGELSFLGEESFPLLRMGAIISGMHGSGVSSFEGVKLLDYFSSRITEPGSGGDVIIKAFLDNPDKAMGSMVQVLEKAGLCAGLPACAVKDFPDGCFLALARTLQKDFPLWGNSKILEVCKEFERQTDLGTVSVNMAHTNEDVAEWMQYGQEEISLPEYLFRKHLPLSAEENLPFLEGSRTADSVSSQIVRTLAKPMNLTMSERRVLYDDISMYMKENFVLENRDPHELRLNLLLSFGKEPHSYMTNLGYMCKMLDGSHPPVEKVVANNALTWLIHQQGYSIKSLLSGERSPFLDSVRAEVHEYPGKAVQLTVCCCADASLLSALKVNSRGGAPLRLDPGVVIGLFSDREGVGSNFGITLDKPLVIPQEMIFDIQVEGAVPHFKYSVSESCYLPHDSWTRAEILPASPLSEVVKTFNAKADVRAIIEYNESPVTFDETVESSRPGM